MCAPPLHLPLQPLPDVSLLEHRGLTFSLRPREIEETFDRLTEDVGGQNNAFTAEELDELLGAARASVRYVESGGQL